MLPLPLAIFWEGGIGAGREVIGREGGRAGRFREISGWGKRDEKDPPPRIKTLSCRKPHTIFPSPPLLPSPPPVSVPPPLRTSPDETVQKAAHRFLPEHTHQVAPDVAHRVQGLCHRQGRARGTSSGTLAVHVKPTTCGKLPTHTPRCWFSSSPPPKSPTWSRTSSTPDHGGKPFSRCCC